MSQDDDRTDDLADRMAALWREGKTVEFYAIVQAELAPRIRRYLLKVRGSAVRLSEEDSEDCVSAALEGLVGRSDGEKDGIANPHAYLWRSAKNAAAEVRRERARAREVSLPQEGGVRDDLSDDLVDDVAADEAGDVGPRAGGRRGWGPDTEGQADDHYDPRAEASFTVEAAVMLAEAVVEDVQPDSSWVGEVVRKAVWQLPRGPRRVMFHILQVGPDYNSSAAPSDLEMNENTYRSNKSRAFSQLKVLIPQVMREIGIDPARYGVEPPDLGLQPRQPFPSDDDDEDS